MDIIVYLKIFHIVDYIILYKYIVIFIFMYDGIKLKHICFDYLDYIYMIIYLL